ncbi:MAG: YbaB/EbfC family nucleoid-associated protein [Gemmatimonadota bacterium]|nr:YbaB/EbfC family nucleoid-associated protein [Gemmatimonadota bacterium]
MDVPNLQQLMQLSQQMQARMAEMQEQLENETVTAQAGGGIVEVTTNGKGQVQKVKIDPGVVDPEDVEMLEDLIAAAASEAFRRAIEKMEGEMQKAAGGLPLPGLGNLLG